MVAKSEQNNHLSGVNWDDKTAYFFKGNQYIRYDIATNKANDAKPIKTNWPGLDAFADGIDAAINWGDGIAYFFKGNQYIRYNIATNKANDAKPIKDNWPSLNAFADGVDAAVNWGNGIAYFFKGNQYIRYNIATNKANDAKPIKDNWPSLNAFADGVDAAVNWGNGIAYFFKGDQYIRYNITTDKVDAGYPKPIVGNWPGLTFGKQEEVPFEPAKPTTEKPQTPTTSSTGEVSNKPSQDSSFVKSTKIAGERTKPGVTNWQPYELDNETGICLYVDTSAAGFTKTPIYITSIGGIRHHWKTTGGSSVSDVTAKGFRVYIRWDKDSATAQELTPAFANEHKWHINWIGFES